MTAFFQDMAYNPFLVTGLLAGLLSGVACGVVGPYVITRRIVFLSGAIAHMAIGGIGAAIWASATFPSLVWLKPIHGAILAALCAAMLIGVIHEKVAERMDTLIGAMWSIGMATGILLIKCTPGYHTELMSYLFGSIALVSPDQVWLMVGLNVVVLGTVLLYHKRLLAICLDSQQAELQGIHVLGTNIVLLCLVALTVICLTQVVGLILVIALLTLPAATAAHHQTRMGRIMLFATVLGCLTTTLPRIALYGTPFSAESAIVLTAGVVYLASILIVRLRQPR